MEEKNFILNILNQKKRNLKEHKINYTQNYINNSSLIQNEPRSSQKRTKPILNRKYSFKTINSSITKNVQNLKKPQEYLLE